MKLDGLFAKMVEDMKSPTVYRVVFSHDYDGCVYKFDTDARDENEAVEKLKEKAKYTLSHPETIHIIRVQLYGRHTDNYFNPQHDLTICVY